MVFGFYKHRKNMRKKIKEVKNELDPIIAEITELAKLVAEDFKENPTDISGSTIQIHEDSPYVDENIPDKGWNKVIKNI